MNTSKLRNSTAVDKALAITAEKDLGINLEGSNNSEQVDADEPAPAADHVAMFLRGISASSSGEIDALVTDLQNLREKLIDDAVRVERSIIAFTTLNQSVTQLAKLISDSIIQVKAPSPAEPSPAE
jgi:hypothetical protein